MTQEIVLPREIRTFTNVRKRQLARTGEFLPAGTKVILDEPDSMVYDHRSQLAVSIKGSEPKTFLIVSEIGIPSLVH
jgi:hypothetical protein